jgi:hypothetical protein
MVVGDNAERLQKLVSLKEKRLLSKATQNPGRMDQFDHEVALLKERYAARIYRNQNSSLGPVEQYDMKHVSPGVELGNPTSPVRLSQREINQGLLQKRAAVNALNKLAEIPKL